MTSQETQGAQLLNGGILNKKTRGSFRKKTSQHQGIQPHPWMAPIVDLLKAKDKPGWGPDEKGMLRTVAAQGIWPAARLKEAGYLTDGKRSCGEVDTLSHRLYACPITQTYRLQYQCTQQFTDARAEQPSLPCWTNALVSFPFDGMPSSFIFQQASWNQDLDPFFEGIGLGDGSGLQGASVHSLKTGWGVTSFRFDQQGRIITSAGAWGPLGGYLQEVNRAEMYAFYFYSAHAHSYDNYYTLYSASGFLVDVWLKSKSLLCSGWAIHADFWRLTFSIQLFKPKAHRSIKSSVDMLDRLKDLGNAKADELAKRGAALQPTKNLTLYDSV